MNLLQSLDHDKLSVIALYKLVLELALGLGLSFEGSFSEICRYAGVNRTQMYERVDQVKGHLEKIEILGPGRSATK
jgi:transcriptional antiterminator Rof (Rho-off)